MKLSYDILWFDDQFQELQYGIKRVENFIKSKGLIPKIEKRSNVTIQEIHDLSDKLDNHNPYDLVICDFDMGSHNPTGVEIAKELRAQIYTDMVFYSGNRPDAIEKIIFENRIQGVFVIHKPSLYMEITPIISDHIKKISSLNGARGLIMSEWSNIEIGLRQLLKSSISSLNHTDISEHKQKIIKRLIKQSKDRIKSLENNPDIFDLIENPFICDSSIIRRSLSALNEAEEIFKDNGDLHLIQNERNVLAHSEHRICDDGSLVVQGKKEDLVYNHEEFQRLRMALLNLKNKIEQKNP